MTKISCKPTKKKGGNIRRKTITPMPDAIRVECFVFDGNPIHILVIGRSLWWVFCDVCKVLGYADPCDVSRYAECQQKCTVAVSLEPDKPPCRRIIVSTSGLCNILKHSRKPNANRFRKWIDEYIVNRLFGYQSLEEMPEMRAGELTAALQQKHNSSNTRKPKKKKRRSVKIYCTFHIIF
jgi:prophage antirepressor-like protein